MNEPAPVSSVSVLTCPKCGHEHTDVMPECSCVIAYECRGCGATLEPAAGDCCVYCTHGSVPCQAIQLDRGALLE